MSSSETAHRLTDADRGALLEIARSSIAHGLEAGRSLDVSLQGVPDSLRVLRASFVTLWIGEALRGCMGSLEASEPLIANVARNAFSAAFRDPRFSPLNRGELPRIHIHLSVLGDAEPLAGKSEAEIVAQIRPGTDGLTLIMPSRRATLLPSVWDTVTDPREFLAHLKRKAGLAADDWPPSIQIERYTTESVE